MCHHTIHDWISPSVCHEHVIIYWCLLLEIYCLLWTPSQAIPHISGKGNSQEPVQLVTRIQDQLACNATFESLIEFLIYLLHSSRLLETTSKSNQTFPVFQKQFQQLKPRDTSTTLPPLQTTVMLYSHHQYHFSQLFPHWLYEWCKLQQR